ncbi:MAG: transcriptional regulator [Thermoprotei archaeon]|nr:MAG: transcriptional regulator [Thermoprotei archaeon]
MASDRTIGRVFIAIAIVGTVTYFCLLFILPQIYPGIDWIVIKITVFLAVALILGIIGYIGYTLITTPSPMPPEELEKMLREEEERIKRELEKENEEKETG